MISNRITELLHAPKTFTISDLETVASAIEQYPYAQSLRGLYLYGIQQFDRDKYSEVLSETAAYTTDKRILYHFINGKGAESQPQTAEEEALDNDLPKSKPLNKFNVEALPELQEIAPPKPVFINGERNRILFEGEEEFLNQDQTVIDLEATKESGTIVVQNEKLQNSNGKSVVDDKSEPVTPAELEEKISATQEENAPKKDEEGTTDLPPEEQATTPAEVASDEPPIKEKETNSDDLPLEELPTTEENKQSGEPSLPIEEQPTPDDTTDHFAEKNSQRSENQQLAEPTENKAPSEIKIGLAAAKNSPEVVENESQLSFQRTDEFLPKVEIKAAAPANNQAGIPMPAANKQSRHESEMQKLLAEVEAKMQASKTKRRNAVPEEPAHNGEISFAETMDFSVKSPEINSALPVEDVKTDEQAASPQPKQSEPESTSSWKPMTFQGNTPDSLIGKSTERATPAALAESPAGSKVLSDQNKNVLEIEAPESEPAVMNVSFFSEEVKPIEKAENIDESNVPVFINTWQNWLKMGKANPAQTEKRQPAPPAEETKTAAIEKFIETEPKISRLSEDNSYLVKDRGDDISHLMTETLANLYVEQRLYTKAIRAFEVLKTKFPDRSEQFETRIKEIKALRQINRPS